MKKLLLCASLATVFALTACDKAPEAAPATDAAKKTETTAVQAPAKEAASAQEATPAKEAVPAQEATPAQEVAPVSAEMQALVVVFEKMMPTDLGNGVKRGTITIANDQKGIIIPLSVPVSLEKEQLEASNKAMKMAMGMKFCQNGKPVDGADKFLANGRYLEFQVSYANTSEPVSFRADEALCQELAQ